MSNEFLQVEWDSVMDDDCRRLVRLAIREDLDHGYDWTTVALVAPETRAKARIVSREPGVVAGLAAIPTVLAEIESKHVDWTPAVQDGRPILPQQSLGTLSGPARDLLTVERLILNLLGHLSGVASLTAKFVQQTRQTPAHIYDTRKTHAGFRRLEKYAVRCGGGRNHRSGLFDAILIKDNHLACFAEQGAATARTAVLAAREFIRNTLPDRVDSMIIEIEVDDLTQLADVLPAAPDIVLLDNMAIDELRAAVQARDAAHCATQLEASGGVNLQTVRAIAESGVERISVGALTHSAGSLDIGLDWVSD